jgi:uncharacterized protein (DUF1684 family)
MTREHEVEHDHDDGEHDHDEGEHEHDDGEHVHTFDWKAELEAMREDARHFYLDHFDWKGHGPPPGFDGPRYYPPAEDWRLVAHLDRSVEGAGDHVTLATSTGKLREMAIAGDLVFTADGQEHRLRSFVTHGEEGHDVLFVPFRDVTSGNETYGAGRYVEVPFEPDVDELELDFNFAYNPSCVFSPAYDCPFPPPMNRLTVPVRAGEMMPAATEH